MLTEAEHVDVTNNDHFFVIFSEDRLPNNL